MTSSSRNALLLLLAALVVGFVSWLSRPATLGPGEVDGGETPAAIPAPVYVGTQTCVGCHEQEAGAWAPSHHALAMQPATPDAVLGRFDGALLEREGDRATFRVDGAGGHEAALTSTEGEVVRPVAYTFGVEPLQQYLVEADAGRLQSVPWAWDTRSADRGGQRWYALYPGEDLPPGDPLHWSGYLQAANHMCVECHVTGFRLGHDEQTGTFESAWAELGVGCEACHGPGSAHVDWAGDPSTPTAGRGLVRPLRSPAGSWVRESGQPTARWEGQPRSPDAMDACWTCHSLRHGFDQDLPQSGPYLDAFMPRLLDAGAYHADGSIDAEVFVYGSFTQSKMYRAGVRCQDCHEPHGLGLRAKGNALCAGCHDPATFDVPTHHHHPPGAEGASCVNCHMPGKAYMGHDLRRDHRLAVPRPDLAVELGTPDTCSGCHADRDPTWAAEVSSRWWPQLAERPSFAPALHAGRTGHPKAELLLATVVLQDHPAIARSTALTLLAGRLSERSLPAIQAALHDDHPLVRVGALRALSGAPPQLRLRLAPGLLEDPLRAVRLEAARLLADVPPAQAPRGLAAALLELESAERANGSRPENLANLLQQRSRLPEADSALRRALQIDPTSVPAWVNLADVLRAADQDAEAKQALRRALELDPTEAAAHHALGLLLIRRGERAEALDHLKQAAVLAPETPRFGYVLAVALRDWKQPAEAADVLRVLTRRHPGALDAVWLLVEILRDMGRREEALEHAQRLAQRRPRDQRVQELLRSLGR